MTREQLEANWTEDAQGWSVPFKRPRLTPKNIADQYVLARPGTLIHLVAFLDVCERAKTMIDVTESDASFIRQASHIENVNCLDCRSRYVRRTK